MSKIIFSSKKEAEDALAKDYSTFPVRTKKTSAVEVHDTLSSLPRFTKEERKTFGQEDSDFICNECGKSFNNKQTFDFLSYDIATFRYCGEDADIYGVTIEIAAEFADI